jgi:hypothetical protein
MGDKAVNNEERRIRQGGKLGKGVFFVWGVIFFLRLEEGEGRRSGDRVSIFVLTNLRTFTGGTCCWEFWAQGPGNRKESWS